MVDVKAMREMVGARDAGGHRGLLADTVHDLCDAVEALTAEREAVRARCEAALTAAAEHVSSYYDHGYREDGEADLARELLALMTPAVEGGKS